MSALAGHLGREIGDLSRVAAMLRVFPDRGPDGVWTHTLGPLALGVGLATEDGRDPAPATDATGRWTVAIDGVPRSYRPLHDELVARGKVEEGASASAVVAAVVAEIGVERALGRLDGEVALAAWDASARRLTLVRDRVGARSLYYATTPAGLLFASDLAAVQAALGAPVVDPAGAARLIRLGFIPPPGTALAGITRLPAGHLLTADADGVQVAPYTAQAVNPPGWGGGHARWARSVEFATTLAIRQRVGEGPIGVAVGGAFSAVVARVAAERRAPVLLFTLAEGHEVEKARELARELRRELVEVRIDDVVGLVDELASLPAPLVTPEAVAWMALARAAWEKGVGVLLTGAGGAESHLVPAGKRWILHRFVHRLRMPAGKLLARPADDFREALDRKGLPDEPVWSEIDALRAACPPGDPEARLAWLFRSLPLPERHLTTLDLVGAAAQVAIRSPLAEARLLALIAEIPAEHLADSHRDRALFLDAFRLPDTMHRPLFVHPDAWLEGPLAADVAALPTALADLVSPEHVAWVAANRAFSRRLWAFLTFSRWRARHAG